MKRFWKMVKVGNPLECWPWQGAINPFGYGRFAFQGKVRQAHRFAWFLEHGELLEGVGQYRILHKCSNRTCVNPAHLYKGTQSENMLQASEEGALRQRRLTDADVELLRTARRLGYRKADLAFTFGISEAYSRQLYSNLRRVS